MDMKSDVKDKKTFMVGIGSSAGGLEAIRELVTNLPKDNDCVYVIVQHMSPQHKSLMATLIGNETELEVLDIQDGIVPEPNVIYVTPPRADVIFDQGKLCLVEPSLNVGKPKPSVDRFLNSLAANHGERSMAIILSGTGSDGAYGVQAIREVGGITIAQDDVSAKYDGMANAAIETGCIDLVLRPSQIGTHLKKILSSPGALEEFKDDHELATPITGILQIVLARTRVDFREYKQTTVQRRIERRMTALGIATAEEYMTHCRSNPPEVDALFKDLLISVTRFFRDRDEFKQLREPIETLIENRKGQPLRIWVAGCATGEEVYSIAIMMAEAMGGISELVRSRTQIFATDIDRAALEAARRGQYSQGALFDVPTDLVSKYFVQQSDGVRVVEALRSVILFSDHNVCQDPPFLNMDLICCRNLLIYFGPKLQSRVLSRLHYAMKSRAYLFLGTAESTSGADQLFLPLSNSGHIFKKRVLQKTVPYGVSALSTNWSQPRIEAPIKGREKVAGDPTERKMFDALARSLGDNSVLVSSDQTFLRVYGDMSSYIDLSENTALHMQLGLLKSPLREEARSLVTLALKHDRRRVGVRHIADPDTRSVIRLECMPVIVPGLDEKLALLIINEWTREEFETIAGVPADTEGASSSEVDSHLRELDLELATTREALQQTIEELETSNEELQALNEELQSTNEELQATNEELETSNEELQSTNEELITVNEELQVNSSELTALNAELGSILGNIPIPLMVLDNALQISRASKTAMDMFEIPQPLMSPHLSQINVPAGFPRFLDICTQALQSGEAVKMDFSSAGSAYSLQCAPFSGASGQLIGTTIVLFKNPAMQSLSNEITQVLDHAPMHLIRYTDDGTVVRVSAATANALGLTPDEAVGRNIHDLMKYSVAKDTTGTLEKMLNRNNNHARIALWSGDSTDATWIAAERFEFEDISDDKTYQVLIGTDVTETVEGQVHLQQVNRTLELVQSLSKTGYWRVDFATQNVFWSDVVYDIHGLNKVDYQPELATAIKAYHPDDRDFVEHIVNRSLKDGSSWSFRRRILRPDGEVVWVESLADVTTGSDGQPISIVGSFRDVTDDHEYSRRFEQLELMRFDQKIGFFSFDVTTKQNYWSEKIWNILDVARPSDPGFDGLANLVHLDQRKLFAKKHDDLARLGYDIDESFGFQRAADTSGIFHIKATAQKDNAGRVTDYFGFIRRVEEA
ncbi:MAG: chemotaxis protein CheB [Pseudomonadota bacterium]